jgi:hypothetical protein
MSNSIIDIPLEFISEYLTGWTILIFIIIIIYFVALRKYYVNKEQFYDRLVDTTDTTDVPNRKNNKNNKIKKTKFKNTVEGFEPTITEQPKNISNTISTQPILDTFIDTTLFDNLKLNTDQVLQCKQFYNTIIVYYIIELSKLIKLIKKNSFLNSEKQFNIIITKGVDDIINFLNNTIKSMIILTRSSIKTDLINILSNTLDNLVEKTNHEVRNYMNELAKLNSTTLDYYTMSKNIDVSRNKIEDYIDIDKLLIQYGMPNTTKNENKVNKVLDKSFILPIYEKNFDRINQLVQSDFNNNYTQLAEKYGTAYTDYLNQKKKEELNVNPLEMLSNIETGVVNFLTNGYGGSNTNTIEQYNDNYSNNMSNMSNPIPSQNRTLVSETPLNKNNIYNDTGNIGNYLIDNKTKTQMIEGFETTTEPIKNTNTIPMTTLKTPPINNKTKKNSEDTTLVSKLFSGDFLNYMMDIINEKLNSFYSMYNTKFNSDNNNDNNGNNNLYNETNFKLDENLIPAGFLLFLLSMMFYFIDVTS